MFSAISVLNGGNLDNYYSDQTYPIDLNGAQDYMRTSLSPPAHFPFPVVIGAVQGLGRFFDAEVFSMGIAKTASGPWQGMPQAPLIVAFPDINGGMVKEG